MGTQGPNLTITEAREAITELAIRIGGMLHGSPHDPVLRRTIRKAIIVAGAAQIATDLDALSKATKEVFPSAACAKPQHDAGKCRVVEFVADRAS